MKTKTYGTKSSASSSTRPQELTDVEITEGLARVPGWQVDERVLTRQFIFEDYYETLSFVNAAAWIAHREAHVPEITFNGKTCNIRYSTRMVGLSQLDFICAAKTNALLSDYVSERSLRPVVTTAATSPFTARTL